MSTHEPVSVRFVDSRVLLEAGKSAGEASPEIPLDSNFKIHLRFRLGTA